MKDYQAIWESYENGQFRQMTEQIEELTSYEKAELIDFLSNNSEKLVGRIFKAYYNQLGNRK